MEYGYPSNNFGDSHDQFERFQIQYSQDSWVHQRKLSEDEEYSQEEERRRLEDVLNFGQELSHNSEPKEEIPLEEEEDDEYEEDEELEFKELLIRQLNEYKQRFKSMLSNVKLASIMLNRDWKVVFVNSRFLELTGWSKEEVMDRDWVETFVPYEKRQKERLIRTNLLQGLVELRKYVENEILTKKGTRLRIGWNNTILKDVRGEIVGISLTGTSSLANTRDDELSFSRKRSVSETVRENNNSSSDMNGAPLWSPTVSSDAPKAFGLQQDATTGDMIGDFIIVRSLDGKGMVKLAVHKVNKQKVAVKLLRKENMNSQELERARREIDIMKQLTLLNNPYIIKLIDLLETDTHIYMIEEYVSGGELVALILKNQGLTEPHAHKLFKQILNAIECCHNNQIIHRDIKLSNILVDESKNIKLIDFGVSNFMEEGAFRNTFCGTPAYASPEILLGEEYKGPEVDLWSLGVVLYSMLTTQFPFKTIADILKGDFKEPETISDVCLDLLKRMLVVKKEHRETLEGVLNHPWIKMDEKDMEKRQRESFSFQAEPDLKRRKSVSQLM